MPTAEDKKSVEKIGYKKYYFKTKKVSTLF
jgi:hypothetical protein